MTTGQPQNVEIKMAVNQERGEKVVHLTSQENAVATRSSNAYCSNLPKKGMATQKMWTQRIMAESFLAWTWSPPRHS